MAVTSHTSSTDKITIRGITYKVGDTFKCYASNTGTVNSEGGSGTAAALTKDATYTFKGYATDDDNGGALTSYPYLIADSLGNTRGWYKENVFPYATYTIKYNANGGSGAPSSQTKTHGATLTLSSTKPTRSGYTFKGWALTQSDANNGTWYYQAGGSCGKNENLTLYAVWEEHKLTVNYYSNYADYGTYQGEALSVSASTNVKVHSQDFLYDNSYSSGLSNIQNSSYLYLTRTGYTSTGYWGTTTTGGKLVDEDTEYSTGQAIAQALGKDISSGNASVNVYAQWKINTYTIAYNSNGGTGNMSSQSVNWKGTFTVSNNTFKREGYKFLGWNLYRNDDSKYYVVGQGWLTESEILAGGYEKKIYESQSELTLDASWIRDNEDARIFTMYAIWEISGVVYIDNGTAFEPYLAYIDNGTSWDLYSVYVDDGAEWKIIS